MTPPPAAPAIEEEEMREAIHAWIREDVPLGGKMNLMPKHVDALLAKLAGPFAQLRSDLQAARDERDKFEADLRAAVVQVGEHARARGEAEGKMRAAKWPGIVDGWRDRAIAAESTASQLSARVRELDEALRKLASAEPLGAGGRIDHGEMRARCDFARSALASSETEKRDV